MRARLIARGRTMGREPIWSFSRSNASESAAGLGATSPIMRSKISCSFGNLKSMSMPEYVYFYKL